MSRTNATLAVGDELMLRTQTRRVRASPDLLRIPEGPVGPQVLPPRPQHRARDVATAGGAALLAAYAASCLGIGGTELAGAERAARRLLERSPLRETGYALLMNALAAQATSPRRCASTTEHALDEELGITPGQAIQQAHARLLGIRATAT